MNQHRRGRGHAVTQALLVTHGLLFPCVLLGGLLLTLLLAGQQQRTNDVFTAGVTAKGEVVRVQDGDTREVFDLRGRRLAADTELSYLWPLPGPPGLANPTRVSRLSVAGRNASRAWYAVRDSLDTDLWQIVGFNLAERRCLGYVGRGGGLRPQPVLDRERVRLYPSSVAACEDRSTGQYDLCGPEGLWRFDSATLRLTLVHAVRDAVAVTSPTYGERWILVRLPDRIESHSAGRRWEYRLPPELLKPIAFNFGVLDQRRAVAVVSGQAGKPDTVLFFDAAGRVLRRETVPTVLDERVEEYPPEVVQVALVFPVPAIWLPTAAVVLKGDPAWPLNNAEIGRRLAAPLATLLLISDYFAAYTWRRQRHYRLRGTLGWVLYVLLFGPVGYAGYLAHRRWPPLEVSRSGAAGLPAPEEWDTDLRA